MLEKTWTNPEHKTLAKFTLEFLYYGYHHLIPERYIIYDNRMLYADRPVFEHCVKQKYQGTFDFMMKLSFEHNIFYNEICETIHYSSSKYGHIDILKWILNLSFRWSLLNFLKKREEGIGIEWEDIEIPTLTTQELASIFGSMYYNGGGLPNSDAFKIAIERRQHEILKYMQEIKTLREKNDYIKLFYAINQKI